MKNKNLVISMSLLFWVVMSIAAPGFAQNQDRSLYLKKQTKPLYDDKSDLLKVDPGKASNAYSDIDEIEVCTDKEFEAYLKARKFILEPNELMTKLSQTVEGNTAEYDRIYAEIEKKQQQVAAVMKRDGFMKTYSDLSFKCFDRLEALKNKR